MYNYLYLVAGVTQNPGGQPSIHAPIMELKSHNKHYKRHSAALSLARKWLNAYGELVAGDDTRDIRVHAIYLPHKRKKYDNCQNLWEKHYASYGFLMNPEKPLLDDAAVPAITPMQHGGTEMEG